MGNLKAEDLVDEKPRYQAEISKLKYLFSFQRSARRTFASQISICKLEIPNSKFEISRNFELQNF